MNFTQVPGMPGVEISITGHARVDGEVIAPTYPKGYVSVTIRSTTMHVHRLLAMAHIALPHGGTFDQYIVNHKNGDKWDFSLSNLEWVNYSGNATHAYQSGLRSDNVMLLCRDLTSGELNEYYSLNECARCLGVNPYKVSAVINSNQTGSPIDHRWLIWLKGTPEPAIATQQRSGLARPVRVCTGDNCEILSRTAAANTVGLTRHMLERAINDQSTVNGYRVTDDVTLDEHRTFTANLSKPKPPTRKPKSVVVISPDGSEVTWNSMEEFANSMGVKKNTIQKAHLTNGNWKGYKFNYL